MKKVRYRDMRELSQEELTFLDEICTANRENDFLAWVDSFEDWLDSSGDC